MMALIYLHGCYLFHLKTQRIVWVLVGFLLITMLYFSGIFQNYNRALDTNLYWFEYRLESLTILKFTTLVFGLFLTLQLYFFKAYTTILKQLVGHQKVWISKTVLMIFSLIIYWLIGNLSFAMIAKLARYTISLETFFSLMLYGTLFVTYYGVLFTLISHLSGHIFSPFFVLIGFLVTELSIDSSYNLNQITFVSKLLHRIFFTIYTPLDKEFSVIYDVLWYVFLLILMIIGLILTIKRKRFTL